MLKAGQGGRTTKWWGYAVITIVGSGTRHGAGFITGHEFGQGEGNLELDRVDGDLADRQNATPHRD